MQARITKAIDSTENALCFSSSWPHLVVNMKSRATTVILMVSLFFCSLGTRWRIFIPFPISDRLVRSATMQCNRNWKVPKYSYRRKEVYLQDRILRGRLPVRKRWVDILPFQELVWGQCPKFMPYLKCRFGYIWHFWVYLFIYLFIYSVELLSIWGSLWNTYKGTLLFKTFHGFISFY